MSDGMRSGQELREAIAILGASFIGPARGFVWGANSAEAARAWAMFQALGWAAGADDSTLGVTLAYASLKLAEYHKLEGENHAS